jgi:hypothetical protein
MVYFVRRYVPGIKHSGTKDILRSEDEIDIEEFVSFAYATGPGKYILGQRGKGIRGFRKITDCKVDTELENPPLSLDTFHAEDTISLRKNVRLNEMSNSELMETMSALGRANIASPDELQKFKTDLGTVQNEIQRRLGSSSTALAAENKGDLPIASAGFGISPTHAGMMGAALGGVAGMVGTALYYRSKIDALTTRLDLLDKNLSEAEYAIKRSEERETKNAEEKKAAPPAQKVSNPFDLDLAFLSSYNQRNGKYYD